MRMREREMAMKVLHVSEKKKQNDYLLFLQLSVVAHWMIQRMVK